MNWLRRYWRPVKAARYYAGLLVRIEQLCAMWMEEDDRRRRAGAASNPESAARTQMVASEAARWRFER
jgi:hypothetical protein